MAKLVAVVLSSFGTRPSAATTPAATRAAGVVEGFWEEGSVVVASGGAGQSSRTSYLAAWQYSSRPPPRANLTRIQ